MTSVLKAKSLTLGYGRGAVLSDVNCEIARGDFWFLIGPNGAGKTTLLRAILGDLRPMAGEISLDSELARRDRIGFVPQRCDLNPHLPTTVREFVLLGMVGVRVARRDRAARLAWALERVGLGGAEERDYWSLSGGQRQRALVARALVRRPELLIVDEPTSGLDLTAKGILLEALVELNREDHLTVLFVTHDLTLATRYGSHFALCGAGGIAAGPAPAVLTPDHLERVYGMPFRVQTDASGTLDVRPETPGGGS